LIQAGAASSSVHDCPARSRNVQSADGVADAIGYADPPSAPSGFGTCEKDEAQGVDSLTREGLWQTMTLNTRGLSSYGAQISDNKACDAQVKGGAIVSLPPGFPGDDVTSAMDKARKTNPSAYWIWVGLGLIVIVTGTILIIQGHPFNPVPSPNPTFGGTRVLLTNSPNPLDSSSSGNLGYGTP
jgi:hypothetical protein